MLRPLICFILLVQQTFAWQPSLTSSIRRHHGVTADLRSFKASKPVGFFGAAKMRQYAPSMSVVEPEIVSINKAMPSSPLPTHPKLVKGKLDNGLTYVILPNSVPVERFEAHLEVLSGSANELDSQQGMAHLLEHVAYMGSPKRQMISGTGSRTNAYTDFHHTVFFAACPSQTPDQFWKKPMLPMALDALLDVLTTNIDDSRLEKERAAVLSEASMVNKMEYRVECQILSSLHAENRIASRFPIGKEELIKKWTKQDLQMYHDTHYRPDNVILFVVGDVDVPTTIETIQQKFGSLKAKIDAQKLLKESGEFPDVSMRDVSPHFPPVVHEWSCTDEEAAMLVPPALVNAVDTSTVPTISSSNTAVAAVPLNDAEAATADNESTAPTATIVADSSSSSTSVSEIARTSRVFKHELLQSFSFHLFAKRPIEPVVSEASFKRELLRRMTLSALQIRLNVQQRQDPLFTFVDFNQLNWPREGCAVCSLDMTTDIARWKEAVTMAVLEIRRLGLYGLTHSELSRYRIATLSEVAQAAAQMEQMGNEDVLNEVMETQACGHTYMHPETRYEIAERVLESVSLDEVNEIARELCEHLSHMEPAKGVKPAAVVACAPLVDRAGQECTVSDAEISDVIKKALDVPLQALEDTPVPDTLISPEMLAKKAQQFQPKWVPLEGKALKEKQAQEQQQQNSGKADKSLEMGTDGAANPMGVVQKRLSNGMRINMMSLDTEPQRVNMRLYIPGGRMLESKSDFGSVMLGARTIQEGGAFLSVSREEVELFCIDHLVMVDIIATEEALILDFQSVTTPGPGVKGVTGIEAVMQVAHIIMTDFLYEGDAFERAKQSFHEQFASIVKGLESACQESLIFSLTGADARFLTPNHKQIDKLDLPTVKKAILRQLNPANIEVSMSGDLSIETMQNLVLNYLGTVPPSPDSSSDSSSDAVESPDMSSLSVKTLGKTQQLGVYLPDSDERAMGYLAGPGPNRWGIYANGDSVADVMQKLVSSRKGDNTQGDGSNSSSGSSSSSGVLGGAADGLKRRLGGGLLGRKKKNRESADNGSSDTASAVAGGSSGKRDPKRDHPLFAYVALSILQEVANRRLFSVVREERQLTYDASFQLQGFDSIKGGWYVVSVTSSPKQVQAAVRACKEALASLKGPFGIMGDSVQSAKRTLLNRFRSDSVSNKFWVDHLTGVQLDCIPLKSLKSITDFEQVLSSVSVQDIQLLVEAFDFTEDNMTACVGVTAAEAPAGMT